MGSEYWQKRFQAVEDMNNRSARKTVQSIMPSFDKAQAQIEKEINAWYSRFASNEGITLTEAKKLLNTRELKEFRWDVEQYIKYGRENVVDQLWMKELENASARFHISRLEALKIRTQNAAEVAFGNELDCIDEMAARVYMDDYYHTAYEIQRGLGIGWDVARIDQKKLNKILSKPWTADKMTFSDRIWKSKTQLIDSLHTELTQMCVLGKAPDQAISNIAKRMNVSKNQAGRLVMTESAYFGSAAQKDCFNDLDVEKFEVVATLDHKTSKVCQEMDGKVFDMKDFEAGTTAPPFHVWCRSCTAPWFEDEDGFRAARDADGQTYYVPSSMKYDEWKKSFVDDNLSGLAEVETVESLQKKIDDLNLRATQKQDEIKLKQKERADVYNRQLEFKYSHKDIFDDFDNMSKSELNKYVEDLELEKVKLQDRYDELAKINDRWYDKPNRGTAEYQEWKAWKETIDFDDFYNEMIENSTKQSEINRKLRSVSDYKDFKKVFGDMTEQDFVDEMNKLKSEIDSLKKERDVFLKEIDNLIAKQTSLKVGITVSDDEFYNKLIVKLQKNDVEYITVEKHIDALSESEIIDALSGGDMTGGSCASVGLAYVGQKQGLNVLDFRGGDSRRIFSNASNLLDVSQMKGMKVLKAEGASSMTVGNRLLKQCEAGKEYYLCVGRHAAIVRKTEDDVLQYLELQSAKRSGWTDFDGNPKYTLKTRFGCNSTSSGASTYDFMIDIDESDFATDEFKSLLGFLNTTTDSQRKGVHGTIK